MNEPNKKKNSITLPRKTDFKVERKVNAKLNDSFEENRAAQIDTIHSNEFNYAQKQTSDFIFVFSRNPL